MPAAARRATTLAQAELGEKARRQLPADSKYEKGVNRVGAARLQQIATASMSPHLLYDGDGKAREVESLLSSTARSA